MNSITQNYQDEELLSRVYLYGYKYKPLISPTHSCRTVDFTLQLT